MRKLILLWSLLSVLSLSAFAQDESQEYFGQSVAAGVKRPKNAVMPKLEGLTVDRAEKRLSRYGVKVAATKKVGSNRSGRVSASWPPPGAELRRGSTVILYTEHPPTTDPSKPAPPRKMQESRTPTSSWPAFLLLQVFNLGLIWLITKVYRRQKKQ